jgi:hypothetical protein
LVRVKVVVDDVDAFGRLFWGWEVAVEGVGEVGKVVTTSGLILGVAGLDRVFAKTSAETGWV